MNLLPYLAAAFAVQVSHGSQVPDQHLPKSPPSTKIVARVNGHDITAGDVEALLWDWRGQEVLQDLVSFELIREEAEKERIEVAEIEVLKLVDDQLQQIKAGLPKGGDLESELRQRGYPQSRLYLKVKTDLMVTRLAEKWFKPAEYVSVSTMVFAPKSAAASDVGEAVKKAEAAYDRLKKGEKWETVLKDTQDVQGLIEANGLLGWRRIDAFPQPTSAELAGLKVGDLTKPVQLPTGIQFFRVEALGSQAKGEQLEGLRETYMQNARRDVLDKIRKNGKVEMLGVKG